MSLSVSSFPGAPSKPTTSPTWGKGPSPTTKRWFFGGRLNTGGSSFMKGIRHIGKVQLKSSVARFAHKPSSQNLRPIPPRLSVRASTIVIDIIAVPQDDEHRSSEDKTHDDPAPAPTSWPRWRTVPLLARIPRARANSSGAGGAASEAAQQARTRVNLEVTKAACGGNASTSLSEKFKTRAIGPEPDLPVVTFTPTDDGDICGSPSEVTLDWKDEQSDGSSYSPTHETRPSHTPLRRSMSSPTIKHAGNWNRIQPLPPPSPPLPLLSVHIARLRTGSRPDPSPLPPLFAIGPRPKTAPTTRVTKPVPLTALPLAPRAPTGHCSTTRDVVDSGSRRSPSNLSRSRSQPQLRAKRSKRASASDGSLSRAGSTSSAFTQEGHPRSAPAVPCIRKHNIPCRCSRQNARAVTGPASGTCRGEWARNEQCPRTAPEPGYVAWPMSPIVVMDPKTAWEMREMSATVARQQARHRRLRNGPR
jgi:hypothetical protein